MRAWTGPWRRAVAGTALAALVLTACGQQEETAGPTTSDAPAEPTTSETEGTTTSPPTTDDGGSATTVTTTVTETAAPTTATVTVTPTTGPPESTEDFLDPGETSTSEPEGLPDLVVTGVRTGVHETYDRVVFDLEGEGVLGWRVRYEDQPALDGSGFPVDLAGDHTLVVTMIGTPMPEPGDDAYAEGQLLVPGTGLSVVTEVLRAAPFEGQLMAYVGTRAEAPYRVLLLEDPARLVVDVAVP